MVNLLIESELSEDQRENASMIQKCADGMFAPSLNRKVPFSLLFMLSFVTTKLFLIVFIPPSFSFNRSPAHHQ